MRSGQVEAGVMGVMGVDGLLPWLTYSFSFARPGSKEEKLQYVMLFCKERWSNTSETICSYIEAVYYMIYETCYSQIITVHTLVEVPLYTH